MFDKTLSPPAHSDEVKHSFPMEHVLLLAMNRPKSLNAMCDSMEKDFETLLDWFEGEPTLWLVRCFGSRASAHDTSGWRLSPARVKHSAPVPISKRALSSQLVGQMPGVRLTLSYRWSTLHGNTDMQARYTLNIKGFGSISRRELSKPVIAAVNGVAFGGAMEMILNCDLVIASDNAKFALPEVKRGVVAAQGGE
jgi:Enoyl-CoA hydratase/isomerase